MTLCPAVVSAHRLGSGTELRERGEERLGFPVPETPADGEDHFEGLGAPLRLAPEGLLPLEDELPEVPLGPVVRAWNPLVREAREEGMFVLPEKGLEVAEFLRITRRGIRERPHLSAEPPRLMGTTVRLVRFSVATGERLVHGMRGRGPLLTVGGFL